MSNMNSFTCPKCGSTETESNEINVEAVRVVEAMVCWSEECMSDWENIYEIKEQRS